MPRRLPRLVLFLILILSLSACSSRQTTNPPLLPGTPSGTAPAGENPTPTSLPPTPTSLPGKALLISASPAGEVQAALGDLVKSADWSLEVKPSLSAADLTQEVRLVVVLQADDSLTALAGGAAQVQFVALGDNALKPAPNLSIIQDARDQQGFMAGYIAAMLTPDWKVGVLSASDVPGGVLARQGFLAGARYFCGICLPKYPPYAGYPLYEEVSAQATDADRQAAADALLAKKVQTIYVTGEANSPQLLDYLIQNGIDLIGDSTPAESVRSGWLATIQVDIAAALKTLWPELSAGKGGASLEAPLILVDINPAFLSEGRMRLVNETMTALQNGEIAPVQVP